jgi:hypothetical protein
MTDVVESPTPVVRRPKTDLERAYDALANKKAAYDTFFRYFDGDAPTPYASLRLKKVFDGLDVNIQENWASVVVNAAAERINLKDIEVDGGGSNDLKSIVDETELLLESDDAILCALVVGEGFLFAWRDSPDDDIEVYSHDPRLCHVFYDPAKPRNKRFGCKWWYDDDQLKVFLNLYYPDHIEYYSTNEECYVERSGTVEIRNFNDFERDPDNPEDLPNPYGEVPIFHLRTGRREPISQLRDVIPLQDAINMAVINMAVNGEYSSAPQKYVITNGEIQGRLRNSPEVIWELPAGDGAGQGTSVGQFTAADMSNFISQIQHYINTLAIITRTPKHYFDGADAPSGESLIIQEAPLVKKCQDIIDRFTVEYRALGAFLLALSGSGKKTDKGTVKPKFADPQSVLPATQADIDNKKVSSIEGKMRIGIPRRQALSELGYDDKKIEEMDGQKREESDQAQEQMLKMQDAGAGPFGLPGGPKPAGGPPGPPEKPLVGAAAVAAGTKGLVKPVAKEQG